MNCSNKNLHGLWDHVCAKPIDLTFLQWYNEYNKTSERLEAQDKSKGEKSVAFLSELFWFFYRGHESGEGVEAVANREVLFPCAGNSLLDSSF